MMALLLWKDQGEVKHMNISVANNQTHLLWEFTSRCNLSCRYCYPSRTPVFISNAESVISLAKRIANVEEFSNIHITGGEPTLCSNIGEVFSILERKQIYLTTNLVRFDSALEDLLTHNSLSSVAVSLDAIDSECNDWLRGCTDVVKDNIKRLLRLWKNDGERFRIRLHCVMTRKNLDKIPSLLIWAKENEISEVSCQPVFIEESHPFFNELALDSKHLTQINQIYDLETKLFGTAYSNTHRILVQLLLNHKHIIFRHNSNDCIKFIDAKGVVWQCPCKRELFSCDSNDFEIECKVCTQCLTCLKHAVIEN